MIEFINYTNKDFEQQFEPDIKKYYQEVRSLLPTLPQDIQFYFMSGGIVHGIFTGGFAYSPDIISLALDSIAADLDELRSDLRASVFHESYHIEHNYTGQTGPFTLLETALQEGAATIFEIQYADAKSKDLFGNYQQHSTAKLHEWLDIIKTLNITRDMPKGEYASIAFYDKTDDIRWKLYKTGTWLVEEYISKINKDIKDITNKDLKSLIGSLTITDHE